MNLNFFFFFLSRSRGQTFRREFSHISEIRSLMPPNVNMMALTATATTATCQKIVCALCMKRCYLITTNPPPKNVFCAVEVKTDLQEVFAPIVEELIVKKKEVPHTCSIMFVSFCIPILQAFAEGKSILSARCTETF